MGRVPKAWAGVGLMAVVLPAAAAIAANPGRTNPNTAPASAARDQLATITVTAQKRAESEQSVPLSMTTITTAALQDKAINTFFDYATKVPNLSFAPTGDGIGTARTVAIRGISGSNVTGFYIDDTPLPDSLDPRVLDIARIEVLRGPQGTLYGARSMGGTVRIITKKPDLENFSATVHAGASSTEYTSKPNWTGDAVVNIPLMQDHVALRLSGFNDYEAGYFKRSFCTDPAAAMAQTCTPLATTGISTVNNVGAVNTSGGAAELTIKFNDNFSVMPRVMMQRATYNGFPLADFASTPGNGIGYPLAGAAFTLPAAMNPTSLTQARWFNVPEGGYDTWGLYSLAMRLKTGKGELVSSSSYFNRKVFETEDETDFTFAAITSFCTPAAVAAGACTAVGSPQPSSISEQKNYQQFSQEVRFVSALDGPVQFVAGGFYSDLHGRLPFAAYYPPATLPNLDATLAGGAQITPGYSNLVFAQDFHSDYQEDAFFGQLSYRPIEPLKFTLGLRWYHDTGSSYGYEEGLAAGGGPAVASPVDNTSENGINPKYEIDYHLTRDDMVYVNVAKGFRPGGVVPIVPAGSSGTNCAADLQQVDPNITLADTRSYRSDSLWNYELGAKTSWLQNRMTIDAAIFDIRWNNIQQEILLSCGFQFIANAGAAESKGGEFELRARPIEPLQVSLGLGYQNAKITQASSFSPQPVGSPVYDVPDWTGDGSLTYTKPINSDWTLVGSADYSYVGRRYSGNNDPAQPRELGSYRLVNLRLAVEHGFMQYALVGKNLTNDIANLGDNRSIAAETPGRPRLAINQPRTIGVEVTASF
ncbi:MAG TPA: TonB-dependent receptor [Steroidobacteraceae bacterium]|nr:TonB-dependent receptor [Steroidobacteraceae bacterium]